MHCGWKYTGSGREKHFELFERYDVIGFDAAVRPTYADIARELGISRIASDQLASHGASGFRAIVLGTLRDLTGTRRVSRGGARAPRDPRMSALTPSTLSHLRAIVAESEPRDVARAIQRASRVGAGGMGTVYLAHDRELDREVALKVLHSGEFGDAQHARMLGEARILASLEHPGIVPIHESARSPRPRIYVMKRVDGQPLDTFRTAGPFADGIASRFPRGV